MGSPLSGNYPYQFEVYLGTLSGSCMHLAFHFQTQPVFRIVVLLAFQSRALRIFLWIKIG